MMTRYQISFWLDDNDPVERMLLEDIKRLKASRKFRPTIKAALIAELMLMEGDTADLLRRYPAIVGKIQHEYHSEELGNLRAELADLRAQLAERNIPLPPPKRASPTAAAPPVKLTVKETADDDLVANLMNSLNMFGGG